MRITLIAVGRLRPPFQDDVEHYRKLLAGLARVELIEVREDERVPKRIPERAHLVLLASDGREFDSIELSRWLEDRRQ
ncbi:MAG: 23S rRNA (pseudouridine(1915)-N(3))-methyltransferase RlmH, partial [Thermoleophilaceae bacterium]